MSPPATKGKKRPASPAPEPTTDLPNSPPTSPDKRIKIEIEPSTGPPYHSVAEAMRAQHKLYAKFEEIGRTPKVKINLKAMSGTTNYSISIANKKTFIIVGTIDEHDMSITLDTVCPHPYPFSSHSCFESRDLSRISVTDRR
jgi:hypothetical protein